MIMSDNYTTGHGMKRQAYKKLYVNYKGLHVAIAD
jgi:hypothetical protein